MKKSPVPVLVTCPYCSDGPFRKNGLQGHCRWKHRDEPLPRFDSPEAVAKLAARNVEAVPSGVAERVEVVPKVSKVKTMRSLPPKDAEVAAGAVKKAAPKPGARLSKKKGLLDWDNFYDREDAELAAEVAAGFAVIDDAFPAAGKSPGGPWDKIIKALAVVAFGVGGYFLYLNRKAAAAAAAAAAPAAPAAPAGGGSGGVDAFFGFGDSADVVPGSSVVPLEPPPPVVPEVPFVPPTEMDLVVTRLNDEEPPEDHREEDY